MLDAEDYQDVLGEFTDWARGARNDLTGLQADIELERFGSDPVDDIYDAVTNLVADSIQMVEMAVIHDEVIEDQLLHSDARETFLTRIERVIHDLQWVDPDGDLLRDLEDAVRGLADDEVVVFT